MAQPTHYDMRFIIVKQDGQNMQCYVEGPSQSQVPSQSPVDKFCIGYLRAVVPKISNATVSALAYTGHPCHRSYVILIPTNQPASNQQGLVNVSDDNPVVEVIACFKIDGNQLKYEDIRRDFTVPSRQMVMWPGSNVKKQECDPQQLASEIQSKLRLPNDKNILDKVKNYLPSAIYYDQ